MFYTTMKKTYIIPELTAVYTAQTLLNSTSTQVTGGGNASESSGNVNNGDEGDVKRSYDVWSDDWSK